MAMAMAMAPLKPAKGEYQRHVSKKDQSLRMVRKLKRKRRVPRTVPRAPFNDSSFLMRVRWAGGSSSYRDFLDHEDYGYGSMDGFLRLRDNRTTSAGAQNLEQRVDRFEVMDLKAKQQPQQQQEASRVRYLEEENLALKGRLVLVQQQVDELRDRLRGNDDSPQSCLES